MRRRSRALGLAAGIAVAWTGAALHGGADHALAARSRARLRVVSVNVEGLRDVRLNQVIEVRLSARVSGASLTDGSIAVVPFDTTTETTGAPRPGMLSRRGNRVVFLPTLPTHVRDAEGAFAAAGSPLDDAFENGSLRPGTDYRLVAAGRSESPAVRGTRRERLRTTAVADFRTLDADAGEPLFLPEEYVAEPPPRVLFANPTDRVLSHVDRYRRASGTPDVPRRVEITLFANGVPIDPAALREPGAVELLKLTPGTPSEPVAGDVLVEQDRNRSEIVFRPADRLDERCTYALRVADTVTDLTGGFVVPDHAERSRLNDIYSYLAAVRRLDLGIPVVDLPDPPQDLIFDWPIDRLERGELKERILDVGDTLPETIDPRVYTVFTVRREPLVRTEDGGVAKRRGGAAPADITRLVTPLGLQGRAGGDPHGNVVIPFTLVDKRSRKGVVELQYGVDVNHDGVIADEEFQPLTTDLRDPRNTGMHPRAGGKRGLPFLTAPGSGRSSAIVWRSRTDLDRSVHRTLSVMHTPQGREIEDPNNPGSPLFEAAGTGVVVRMRSRRGSRTSRGWVYSEPFEVSDGTRPDLTIDAVTPGASTLITWSAIDDDSEDFNGNGELDPLIGEDVNGNGVLEEAFLAVAFDFVVLGAGEDVGDLTREELAELGWSPCTRDEGAGDSDLDRQSSPFGIAHDFAWDHDTDGVATGERVILRGQTFDDTRQVSGWVYRTEAATISD